MKKHEMKEVNYYYVTYSTERKFIGLVKPGTTQQADVKSRFSNIKHYEPNMRLFGYLAIYNTSKARLEAMEHEIKADLVDAGFEHLGNDHFEFAFAKKSSRKFQYNILCLIILTKAMKYCDAHGLKYDFIQCA